jgi:HAMP domain-containing protein
MTLALEPQTQTFWWATLGTGLIVAIVVVILLHALLIAVRQIEDNVKVLWQTATTVARNTATSWLLGNTADGLGQLKAEALRHDAMLSSALQAGDGAVRTNGGRS